MSSKLLASIWQPCGSLHNFGCHSRNCCSCVGSATSTSCHAGTSTGCREPQCGHLLRSGLPWMVKSQGCVQL